PADQGALGRPRARRAVVDLANAVGRAEHVEVEIGVDGPRRQPRDVAPRAPESDLLARPEPDPDLPAGPGRRSAEPASGACLRGERASDLEDGHGAAAVV